MRRKGVYIVLASMFVVLSGCQKSEKIDLQTSSIVVPIEKTDSIQSYWTDGDVVYYSINPSTGDVEIDKNAEFTSDMNTKIYKYDKSGKQKSLLYEYDEGQQIEVNDMGVCGNILYWDDNTDSAGFRVAGYDLKENKYIGTLFDYKDVDAENMEITPDTDGEKIYFTIKSKGIDYIYEYKDGKLSKLNTAIYISSEYEHLDSYNGIYAIAISEDKGYRIAELTENGKTKNIDDSVYEHVSLLQISDKYVSFISDGGRHEITVINRKNKKIKRYKTDDMFNYVLHNNYIVINCNDYFKIIDLDTDEECKEKQTEDGFYLWLFDRDSICTSLNENEILIFK